MLTACSECTAAMVCIHGRRNTVVEDRNKSFIGWNKQYEFQEINSKKKIEAVATRAHTAEKRKESSSPCVTNQCQLAYVSRWGSTSQWGNCAMGFSLYNVLCVAKQAYCVSPTSPAVHTWTNSGKYSGMKQLEYNG